MIIVGGSERSKYVSSTSFSCLLDEPDGAYIFTIQTPRQYAATPRPVGNFEMLVT